VYERGEAMNTEEIFQQVMDENCKDPLHRFSELVRQDEREACLVILETYPTVLEMIKAIRGRTE
jgi:hypothetical protein